MNIGSLITRHARYRPDHIAVVFENERLSYRAFNRRVNQLSNALLRHGLKKGDKLATVLPNCMELLTLYWACAKTGVVIVPMSPLLLPAGLSNLINDSDSVFLLVFEAFTDIVEPIRRTLTAVPETGYIIVGGARQGYQPYADFVAGAADTEPPDAGLVDDDVYNIFYSSGTTGAPKGIIHNHYIRAQYCQLFASSWRMTPESVVLHSGAIIFNGAFLSLMPNFFLGSTFILHKAFDPETYIKAITEEQVTHVVMVPSQVVAVMNSPSFSVDSLQSLEAMITVGAPLHLEHKKRFEAALPGRFYELYGLTEGFFTVLDKLDFEKKHASVGAPTQFCEIRIVDEGGADLPTGEVGEIIGRSPALMPGYYKRPDLTAEAVRDGWLYSGDMGWLDEDGFLYLADRKKDMIISGGVNVYPRDIEEVAAGHGSVREVAVFGIPDDKWGETPVAAIVLKIPGSEEADEMRDWINARVEAKFQRVSRVIFMSEFPCNAAGKILKREMRDEFPANTIKR